MKFLVSLIVGITLVAGSFLGINIKSFEHQIKDHIDRYVKQSLSDPKLGSTLPIAGTTYSLSGSGINSSATSITLQSLTIPQTGQLIKTSDLSTTFYLTLEPGNRTRQEIIGCTTVTQNGGGTATLSGCSRGLAPISPFTASTTLQFNHAGGTTVIFSDPPQLFNEYVSKQNTNYLPGTLISSSTNPLSYDQVFGITASTTSTVIPYVSWIFNNFVDIHNNQTIAGIKTFSSSPIVPTPSTATQVANKSYVDGVALVSAPNADTTTKGVVEEATVAEINSGASTGGTGAKVFITPASFAQSNFASSTIFSTTTTQGMASTTADFSTLTSLSKLDFWFHASSTNIQAAPNVYFNGDLGPNYYSGGFRSDEANTGSGTDVAKGKITIPPGGNNTGTAAIGLHVTVFRNSAGDWKRGTYELYIGEANAMSAVWEGTFIWRNNSSAITSITVDTGGSTVLFATSTTMQITGF